MTKDEIITAVHEALDARRSLDNDTHAEHHAFIQMMIDDRARHAELWKKFQSSLVGGVALAVLGSLGWVGKLILEAWQHAK